MNMAEAKPDIVQEVKVIPWWATGLAVILFAGLQLLLHAALFPRDPHSPPLAWRIFIGIVGGVVLAFFVLLVGYVNRDAKRRGMSVTLWTLVVIFVPDAIGFIIYFLMRQPQRVTCPNCGTVAEAAFNFCPKCKFNLHPACPECHHPVRAGDLYCPFCAKQLPGAPSRPSPIS
jgi:RNA polymerase subunit RPABC4/transcription elongation factor Spt4